MPQERPSYLNISINGALSDLPGSIKTQDLSTLANLCNDGCQRIVTTLTEDTSPNPLRLFSIWEITRYLIPIDAVHFRRVLRQNPNLPQGKNSGEGTSKWFSMDEVLQLRVFFNATGSKSRTYLPYRPAGLPARISALANTQGKSGKTTTCAHLAIAAALDGYKVLVIDLDSQAKVTQLLHGQVCDEWCTIMPLIARHYVEHQRVGNKLRIDRGEVPISVDDELDKVARIHAKDLVQSTHWPNIDLIGAGADLSTADLRIADWRLQARNWKFWEALTTTLSRDGILDRYDLILVDTPPHLGQLSIAGLVAARILLVPLGAFPDEFAGTGKFFAMLYSVFQSIEDVKNVAARALGTKETFFSWDVIRAMITRYDPVCQSGMVGEIQASLGSTLWSDRQNYSTLVGPTATVYEADYRDTNRATHARARESFDATYGAFKCLMVGSWRREELACMQKSVS
jgi:chromosome partitioning protein